MFFIAYLYASRIFRIPEFGYTSLHIPEMLPF